jgi:hypothetical protein
MKMVLRSSILMLASFGAVTAAYADAGSMSCAAINRPHDPKPVKNWLRGFVAASGYSGNYQTAASQVGALCMQHPSWSLSDAANDWLQGVGGANGGGSSTSVTQQQIQQKQLIINVNPNIAQ